MAANSAVDYGTSASYGSSTPANAAMVTSHQAALTNLATGTLYHFRVRSTDASNGSAASGDMTFATAGDTTPPTVSITSPAANATLTGTVNVNVTASDNVGVTRVQLKVDNANTGAAVTAAPFVFAVNTSLLSNGNHILTAAASDAAGNSATSAPVAVKVNNGTPDTTPPTVSITAPANGATVSGTVSVTATASDNVGVASVQFQLDGANFGALETVAPYAVSWNSATSSNGSHTVRAIAKDAAGNSTTSAGVTVTVSNVTDTTPPTVSITAPANGATVSGTVSVTATASDNVGVASVQFRLDGANLGSLDTVSPYSASWDTTSASNGSHALQAIAKDAAGNSTTSATVNVTVSNLATPPPTGTVTSFQLTSPTTGTFPFTVGLGFKKGDIPGTAVLSLPNQQVITKATWSDGSIKTAIASGRVALTANTAKTVNVQAGTPVSGTNITCANIQTAAPAASVQLGSFGTVSLSSLLASPFRTWASGPEMGECHYRGAVGSDATLVVWFHVRLYADGRMWIRVAVENGYLDVTPTDKSYVPTVTIGGTAVFNNGGASLTNYAQTRWSAEGWIGGDPQVTPRHDTRYLEASKLVPNYMNLTPSSGALSGLKQTYTQMTNAGWTLTMGDTGYQDQIGILPLWDAMFITSNGDPQAYSAVLTAAKALNSYPIVWDDSVTHLPPSPSNRPTWTVLGQGGGGATSIGAGSLVWDVAHHGSGGYLAYLLTGDYYYFETLEDQAATCYLMSGSANGSGVNRKLGGQTRGLAWCIRTIGQFVAVGGNDPIASDYRTLLTNLGATYNSIAQQPGMNQLGYVYSYEIGTNVYSSTASVIAPWQEDFLTQSVGFVSDLESPSNMTTWNSLRDYLYKSPVGRLGPNGATNYCFTEAAMYNQQVADAPGADPTQWYPDWGTAWTKNEGSPNTSCGNTLASKPGTSIPANASSSYWGNMMPAIAYAVDHGATGAAASWTRLTGASNWSVVQNSGFNDTPIWGVVPRTGSTTPPPPPPTTTVSLTAPTAGATVKGTIAVTASASSSNGIAGVQFQLDGANPGAEVTTSPYSMSWNSTTVVDGSHFLVAVARDGQGNLTASSSVNVNVSNTLVGVPPVITAVVSIPSITSAIITWTTDKNANSQIEYGTTSAYGSQTALDATLVTAHMAIISGLTASTTYQFRVHSTDAGGNATVSNNFSFTTTAQTGGGIPSSLGWFQIPNSTLAPNCPNDPTIQGNDGCIAVISTWSGGTADTKRNRLLIWGGGHTDYYGNEVYALDLNALTMQRITNPTTNPVHCVDGQPDGTPSSRHTYDDLTYMANVDKMFSFGGAPGCDTGIGSDGTWMLDIPTLKWQHMDPVVGGAPDGSLGLAVTDYDPVTQKAYMDNGFAFYSYDYNSNTYTTLNSNAQIYNGTGGVVDQGRRLFMILGLGKARAISIATGSSYAMQTWDGQLTGCDGLVNASYPGLAYDSKQGLIVGWVGGDTVYLLNPSTKSCTTQTFAGGPGAAQANGTNGRFAYFPLLNLFAVVNDWKENAYTLRLTQ